MPAHATTATATPTTTGHFATADGLQLYERAWLPDGTPRSVVILTHGYAEHSGRYSHVASFLVERGHALYTYDQRGYGLSEGLPAYVDRFEQYVDDLSLFLQRVRERIGHVPLFLFGHSMGGAVVLRLSIDRSPDVDGLILSSPAICVGEQVPRFLRRLSGVLAAFVPRLALLRLKRNLVSRDPAVISAAMNDPLNYKGRIRARTAHEIKTNATYLRERMDALRLPFLVFHGTADRIAAPRGSYLLYQHARSEDKTLDLYEGFYHETFNEPEKRQVLLGIHRWIEEHL